MESISLGAIVGHDVLLRYETDSDKPPTVIQASYLCNVCEKTAETLAGLSLFTCE